MKQVLRKDLRDILSPVVMMGICFILLECMLLIGVGMRNVGWIVTCINLATYAAAITLVYHIYTAGRVYLLNLRERKYYYDLNREGVSKYHAVIWKYLYTFLSLAVFATAYVAALYFDLWVFGKAFPSEREKFAKFGVREMIQGKTKDAFAPALASTIFEYATAGMFLLALIFAVVAFTYSLFHRTKLCGINCALVYIVMFMAFLKVYAATIAGSTGITAHVRAGIMQLVLTVALMALALYMMRKIVPDEESSVS